LLPNFSPRSRRGRKLRRLLRIHEAHYARVWADHEASGVAAAAAAKRRIEEDLQSAANAALDQGGGSIADVALQAAALLAVKLGAPTMTSGGRQRSSWRCLRLREGPVTSRVALNASIPQGGFRAALFCREQSSRRLGWLIRRA
jgi:hypothetical protein